MNETRTEIIEKLWKGNDPLKQVTNNLYEEDLQGWNSDHEYLRAAMIDGKPAIVVEIGVWKGRSSVFMANHLRSLGASCALICVDTWLGSSEHWSDPNLFSQMPFLNGYPAMYYKFLSNVSRRSLGDIIIPLPLDSINAAHVLKHAAIVPDVIHLDGGHEYLSVIADLEAWWPVLRAGGLLIGDDYYPDARLWPGVQQAFNEFFGKLGLEIESQEGKCRVRKPSAERVVL